MDELDLIQEAVSNWESLQEVASVETCAVDKDAAGNRTFLSRILLKDRKEPVFIEMRPVVRAIVSVEGAFNSGKPVAWSKPGYSLN